MVIINHPKALSLLVIRERRYFSAPAALRSLPCVGCGLCRRRRQSPQPTQNTCELPEAVRSQEERSNFSAHSILTGDTMSNINQAGLNLMHRYWNAANYLTVGQIYLQDNPLLREPLRPEHIKPRLLGHWGTSPGLSFIYVHLNRLI